MLAFFFVFFFLNKISVDDANSFVLTVFFQEKSYNWYTSLFLDR